MTPPAAPTDAYWDAVEQLAAPQVMADALAALERADRAFAQAGIDPGIDAVRVGIFPFHPDSPQLAFTGGYTGFGGIAGSITLTLWPNDYTLPRVAPAAAHEFNHQVRFVHQPFGMNVSVADYIVAEGLAESFAAELYGADLVGPWVTDHTPDDLARAKALIGAHLDLRGFMPVRQYIFGDEDAAARGQAPIGMPRFGGYDQVVQAYLRATGSTAASSTCLPASEIIAASGYFA